MRIERRKNRSITRKITDKKEADYFISCGATLIKKKGNTYYFDSHETEIMKLQWKLKLDK